MTYNHVIWHVNFQEYFGDYIAVNPHLFTLNIPGCCHVSTSLIWFIQIAEWRTIFPFKAQNVDIFLLKNDSGQANAFSFIFYSLFFKNSQRPEDSTFNWKKTKDMIYLILLW